MNTELIVKMAYLMIPIFMVKIIFDTLRRRREEKRKQNPIKEEVPRDAMERLVKMELHIARSQPKFWWRKIIFSGDAGSRGMVLGWTNVIVPTNSMYIIFYRLKWWRVWEEYKFFYVEPELCGDLNSECILIKGRGFTAYDEHTLWIEPAYKTRNSSKIYVNRSRWLSARIMKLTDFDIKNDIDFILKVAMRGNIMLAKNELMKIGGMPSIDSDKYRENLEKQYEAMYGNKKEPNKEEVYT